MERATAHPNHQCISSEDVQGTEVYGPDGKNIGEIDHLIIDKISGRVGYAVMSFGGFLGLGHSHYPIPWGALSYDKSLGGFRTNITEGQLRDAPEFSDARSRLGPGRIVITVHRDIGKRGRVCSAETQRRAASGALEPTAARRPPGLCIRERRSGARDGVVTCISPSSAAGKVKSCQNVSLVARSSEGRNCQHSPTDVD